MKRIITIVDVNVEGATIARKTVLGYEIATLNSYLVKVEGKLVPIPKECAELLDKTHPPCNDTPTPTIMDDMVSKGAKDGSAFPPVIINIQNLYVNDIKDVDKVIQRITRTFNATLKKLGR